MRITKVINQILLLLLSVAACNVGVAQSKDHKEIERLVERYRVTMEKPDSAVLADLASDNLEYVHSSGTVRDKRGFINEFINKQTVVTNVKFSNQTIRFSGDLAVVRNRMEADFHVQGYPPKLDIIILMVWLKENGKWKMLARQAAKLPVQ
jgi:ketosteroid isomerase-like protein